jgi:hypothetical protein
LYLKKIPKINGHLQNPLCCCFTHTGSMMKILSLQSLNRMNELHPRWRLVWDDASIGPTRLSESSLPHSHSSNTPKLTLSIPGLHFQPLKSNPLIDTLTLIVCKIVCTLPLGHLGQHCLDCSHRIALNKRDKFFRHGEREKKSDSRARQSASCNHGTS